MQRVARVGVECRILNNEQHCQAASHKTLVPHKEAFMQVLIQQMHPRNLKL